jgi:hypothetical protein
MDRREFFVGAGAGLIGAACGSRIVKVNDCHFDEFLVAKLPLISPALKGKVDELLAWMRAHGWFRLLGWPDRAVTALDQTALFDPTRVPSEPAFSDFAGQRAIHPGRPELSLLYHALASRRAIVPGAREQDYPTLTQLDTLENFIYALHTPPADQPYVLAVMAYEYRLAAQTPHGRHADLVFSRTGIARVGSEPLHYDPKAREFTTLPRDGGNPKAFAVTGARYALFLARVVSDGPIEAISWEKADAGRRFLFPERKMFSGDLLTGGARVVFGEQHRSERLARLMQHLEPRGLYSRPPFVRISSTFDRQPQPGHDPSLVNGEAHGDSLVVSSVPGALVRYAEASGSKLSFPVPAATATNRQYTTLELGEIAWNEAILEGFALWRRRGFIELRRPNQQPMLVNIRYRIDDKGDSHHLDAETPAQLDVLNKGGYRAALFEDSICDGCVVAELRPRPVMPALAALGAGSLPAFSLVTAPDFSPKATGWELDDDANWPLADNFVKGGTIPLSTVRLPASRAINRPDSGRLAFPEDELASGFEVSDTVTAVISRDSKLASRSAVTPDGDRRSGALPDAASGIFYPGWDVTYAEDRDGRFLSTLGLGSPFVEDAKLCAAANGMWPAASPDSARTYQGALVSPRYTRGYYYSRTATPLTDDELGFHADSPAVKEHGLQETSGWDGESGPFLVLESKRVWVNFADIGQVDLVENCLDGRWDACKLRELSTGDLVRRMEALRRVIERFEPGAPVRQTSLWLISFEAVPDWKVGARAVAIPDLLRATKEDWGTAKVGEQRRVKGAGFFAVLIRGADHGKNPPQPAGPKRLRQQCEKIFVAQIGDDAIASTSWDPNQPQRALSWTTGP